MILVRNFLNLQRNGVPEIPLGLMKFYIPEISPSTGIVRYAMVLIRLKCMTEKSMMMLVRIAVMFLCCKDTMTLNLLIPDLHQNGVLTMTGRLIR